MLLGKRDIDVVSQYLVIENKKYKMIDCIELIHGEQDLELIERLDYLNQFKIEELIDFDLILSEYEKNYKKIYPLIELYFNVVKYDVPKLTRFVNDLTMLENYSREFDDFNALSLTISKKGKIPKNGADYVDRVKSLINNVNSVFKLSTADIDIIAKKIKDARTYYIHYDLDGRKLTDDEIFWYMFFIEDIITTNIYLLLGIDINSINNTYNNFYYNIQKMIL